METDPTKNLCCIYLCCKRALLQLLWFVRTVAIHENTCPHIYTTNW